MYGGEGGSSAAGLDFSNGVEDKDVSSRCDIAVEVRRKLPDCRVYLVCEDEHPERLPALDKAVELKLIDGYCIGDLSAQQMRIWLEETAESMKAAKRRSSKLGKEEP